MFKYEFVRLIAVSAFLLPLLPLRPLIGQQETGRFSIAGGVLGANGEAVGGAEVIVTSSSTERAFGFGAGPSWRSVTFGANEE